MADQFFLTERDRDLLDRLHRNDAGRRENAPVSRLGADVYDDTPQAPETYIALVPFNGIPATSGGVGTSLGYEQGDQPGWAECYIYRILPDGELYSCDFFKRVYNISNTRISQQWVTIVRDKWGQWIAQTGGGGGACPARNEIWQAAIKGIPTGGTVSFTLEVDSTQQAITNINYNVTAAQLKTALVGHSKLTTSDLVTSGGPWPNIAISIEFTGDYANTDMVSDAVEVPYINFGSLTGGSGLGADVYRWQPGSAGG